MSVKHEIVPRDPRDLRENPRNTKIHTDEDVDEVVASIKAFGFTIPILVAPDDMIIAGHKRNRAALKMGMTEVPTIVAEGWSDDMIRAYVIADNRLTERSAWNVDLLAEELAYLEGAGISNALLGFSDGDLEQMLKDAAGDLGKELDGTFVRESNGALSDRFGVPPFTVLNAREGGWQDRKRAWLALGIRSEIGRGIDSLTAQADAKAARKTAPGRSPLPAANYSKNKARGDGAGRPMKGEK